MNQMNIRQAARWAQKKDCVVRTGYDGQPEWMYAVYSTKDNSVQCLGNYDKCESYMTARGENGYTGTLRKVCLDDVLSEIAEEEGESACYLGEREEGVSWAAC